ARLGDRLHGAVRPDRDAPPRLELRRGAPRGQREPVWPHRRDLDGERPPCTGVPAADRGRRRLRQRPDLRLRATRAVRRRARLRHRLAGGGHGGARRLLGLEDDLRGPRSGVGLGAFRAGADPRARRLAARAREERPTPRRPPADRLLDRLRAGGRDLRRRRRLDGLGGDRRRRASLRRRGAGAPAGRARDLDLARHRDGPPHARRARRGRAALRRLLAPASDEPVPRRGDDPPGLGLVPRARRQGRLDPGRRAVQAASGQDVGREGGRDGAVARPANRPCALPLEPVPEPARGLRPELEPRDRVDARCAGAREHRRNAPRAVLHHRRRGLLDRLPRRLRGGREAARAGRGPAPARRSRPVCAGDGMSLRYVPRSEFERILALGGDRHERAAAFSDACRLNALYMIERAGSGHPGTTLSSIDVVSWLHLEVLRDGDRYFSSKGHDVPGLYAILLGLGKLDWGLIHGLRRFGGLPGHPDVVRTPEVVTSTGSLGMGVSKARGFVLANRFQGRPGRVYVLTGDGELQEGQFWESLQQTANRRLAEITVIVDRNLVQSDTWVSEVNDLGDLEGKLRAFGWEVGSCDGHDFRALAGALDELDARPSGLPKALVARTRKGGGV